MRGAFGSGASGSSTMRARVWARPGTPDHSNGGDLSAPSHVYAVGIAPPLLKAGEVKVIVMTAPQSWAGGSTSVAGGSAASERDTASTFAKKRRKFSPSTLRTSSSEWP